MGPSNSLVLLQEESCFRANGFTKPRSGIDTKADLVAEVVPRLKASIMMAPQNSLRHLQQKSLFRAKSLFPGRSRTQQNLDKR